MKTVYIVKGLTSGDPDIWPGVPQGSTEYQFSDGPAGNRSSSNDHLTLESGFAENRGCRFIIDSPEDFDDSELAIIARHTLV